MVRIRACNRSKVVINVVFPDSGYPRIQVFYHAPSHPKVFRHLAKCFKPLYYQVSSQELYLHISSFITFLILLVLCVSRDLFFAKDIGLDIIPRASCKFFFRFVIKNLSHLTFWRKKPIYINIQHQHAWYERRHCTVEQHAVSTFIPYIATISISSCSQVGIKKSRNWIQKRKQGWYRESPFCFYFRALLLHLDL